MAELDFIYRPVSELNRGALFQGDVLEKTSAVAKSIGQEHRHYAETADYSHFIVLTQSCDLVRRQGRFKASCITIAVARPFGMVIDAYLDSHAKNLDGTGFIYFTGKTFENAKRLLERHLNNTEPGHFFLPATENSGLAEDLVVSLRLAIALDRKHYETLAQAKVAETADVFRAKLGWLKGDLYSRVATPDIDEQYPSDASKIKGKFYDRYISEGEKTKLSAPQAELLRQKIKQLKSTLQKDLDLAEIQKIVKSELSEDTGIIATNIAKALVKKGLITSADEGKVTRAIARESSFRSAVKS